MERSQKSILTCMCQITKGDEILVLDKVSRDYSGVTFPGGHIEKDEIITDAVVREVFEETGLHIKNPVLCGIYDWLLEDGARYFVFLYRADKFEGKLQSSAEGTVRWIKKDHFMQEELAEGMETVFRITNSENLSECFWIRSTKEEILK